MAETALLHLFEALRQGRFQLHGCEFDGGLEVLVSLLEDKDADSQRLKYPVAITDALACKSLQLETGPCSQRELLFKVFRAGVNLCLTILEKPSPSTDFLLKQGLYEQQLQFRAVLLLATLVLDGRAAERGDAATKVLLDLSRDDFPFFTGATAHVSPTGVLATSSSGDAVSEQAHMLALLAGDAFGARSNNRTLESGLAKDILLPCWGASALQHYAITQLRLVPRLLAVCVQLAQQVADDKEFSKFSDGDVSKDGSLPNTALDLCSSILKLLVSVASGSLWAGDVETMSQLLALMDAVPPLYGLPMAAAHNLSSVPTLLDDVLRMMELCLPNMSTFQNMRVELVMAILVKLGLSHDALENQMNRQIPEDVDGTMLKSRPIICTPYAVSHLLDLLQDIYAVTRTMKGVLVSANPAERGIVVPSTHSLHSRLEQLQVPKTMEEQVRLLFPPERPWLDNLISTSLLFYEDWKQQIGFEYRVADREQPDSEDSSSRSQEGSVGSHGSEEDDLWFGDLFAEPSRHSEEGTSPKKRGSCSQHGAEVGYLQAAQQILVFFSEFISAPDSEQDVFLAAKQQIQARHLDAILQLATTPFTFLESVKRKRSESAEQRVEPDAHPAEDCGETPADNQVAGLVSASFHFLEALLVRCALTDVLEAHLAQKLLSCGLKYCSDERFSQRPSAALILLARLLIQRSARGYVSHNSPKHPTDPSGNKDDPLIVELWQKYCQSMLQIAEAALVTGLKGTLAKIPSVLLLEVLLMAFHILSVDGKTQVWTCVTSCLKNIVSNTAPDSGEGVSANGEQEQGTASSAVLAAWLLPVSRLVLVIKHMACYADSFPAWLPRHLQHCLRQYDSSSQWASNYSDRSGIGEWEEALVELADPMDEPLPEVMARILPAKFLARDLNDVIRLILRLMELAGSFVPNVQEEILVERYVHHICWQLTTSLMLIEPHTVQQDPSSSFSMLCQLTILRQSCESKGGSALSFEHTVLKFLHTVLEKLQSGQVIVGSFEYFRLEAVLQCCLDLLLIGTRQAHTQEHLSVTSRSATSPSVISHSRTSAPGSASEDSESDDGAANRRLFSEAPIARDSLGVGLNNKSAADFLLQLPRSQQLDDQGHQFAGAVQGYLEHGGGSELLQLFSRFLRWHVKAWQSAVGRVLVSAIPGSQQDQSAVTMLLLRCPGQDSSRLAGEFQKLGIEERLVETLLWPGGLEAAQADALRVVIGGAGHPLAGESRSYLGKSLMYVLLKAVPSSGGSEALLVLVCQMTVSLLLRAIESSFDFLSSNRRKFDPETADGLSSGPSELREMFSAEYGGMLSSLMEIYQEAPFAKLRLQSRTILERLFASQAELLQSMDMHSVRCVELLSRELVEKQAVTNKEFDPVLVKCMACIEAAWTNSQSAFLQYFEGSAQSTAGPVGKDMTVAVPSNGSGNISFLICLLNNNFSQAANVSVLRLLVAMLQGRDSVANSIFRRSIGRVFQTMDSTTLAIWLEHRLLGSGGVPFGRVSSPPIDWKAPPEVRSLASQILEAIVQENSRLDTGQGRTDDLRMCLVDALLQNVRKAFTVHNSEAARDYLLLLARLARGESVPKVLETLLGLMEEFQLDAPEQGHLEFESRGSTEQREVQRASSHRHLEGLETVLVVLNSALLGCQEGVGDDSGGRQGRVGKSGPAERHWQKELNETAAGQGMRGREAGMLNASTTTANSVNSGGQILLADSADEEEDDDLTDGEVEDEEGLGGGERALASRICTYTSSGNNFMEQHWYFCYSCDLTVSKGCCSVCAAVCHKGHKVVYSRHSRFFCDCGAGASGGIRAGNCISLKPRKFRLPGQPTRAPPPLPGVTSSGGPSVSAETSAHRQALKRADAEEMDEEEEEAELDADVERLPMGVIAMDGQLLSWLRKMDVERKLLHTCQRLLALLETQPAGVEDDDDLDFSADTLTAVHGEILRLKRAFKSGSLDMKTKTEYSSDRDLKACLSNGALAKSIVSVSSRGRMAAGEGDKVTVLDVGQLIGQSTAAPVTVDKTTVKALSRNAVRFGVVHVEFNPSNESFLAVAGFEDCQVFTLNTGGEVIDRLAVELALHGVAHIRRIQWVPNSQIRLMVVTSRSVEFFVHSVDHMSPCMRLEVDGDTIQDAVLVPITGRHLAAVVLTQQGMLYSEPLNPRKENTSLIVLKSVIRFPEALQSLGNGASLCYSTALRFLVVAFEEGRCLFGRLNADATAFKGAAVVEVEQESQARGRSVALHKWHEVLPGSGLFVWTQSGSVFAVQVRKDHLEMQQLRMVPSSSSLRLDGVGAYQPPSGDRSAVFLLNDDGSLQIFSYAPRGGEEEAKKLGANGSGVASRGSQLSEADQARRLGTALAGLRTSDVPTFPFDFFERATCITPDIKLGGDILRNTDAEAAKLSVTAEDGFLESPSASGFKLMVFNSNADLVMVGCRVHVGNTSASHIPVSITVFNRTVRLEEGLRRWYEIPFTNLESLVADKEFTLTVGPTFNGTALPRIDNLDVYARTKEDFGYKDRVEAVLEQDLQGGAVSGGTSSASRSNSAVRVESETPLEQALCCGLHALRLFYKASAANDSFGGSKAAIERTDVSGKGQGGQSPHIQESVRHKGVLALVRPILETGIRQGLQVAARGVLRALYPSNESYFQVKDGMRLAGIARSIGGIRQRMLRGGRSRPAAVLDYMEHLQAACRIATVRFPNFAAFLDKHGVEIMQMLVDAMWAVEEAGQLEGHMSNQLVFLMVNILCAFAQYLVKKAVAVGEAPTEAIAAQLEPAVTLIRALLFAQAESVSSACSLALSSHLLQLPPTKPAMDNVETLLPETAVQYCCDGCKKCPIVHHRWHCTVCPDFDLCEDCYQAMFAGSLPVSHTLTHPMTAIPIDGDGVAEWPAFAVGVSSGEDVNRHPRESIVQHEERLHEDEHVERIGTEEDREDYMDVDDGEVEGQADRLDIPEAWRRAYELMEDMSEEALVELAKEMSLQEQESQLGSVREETAAGLQTIAEVNTDSFLETIGPSWQQVQGHTSAVQSRSDGEMSFVVGRLLLQQLMNGMGGWMKRCSGMDALPVFQLFYRLGVASARGSGPLAAVPEGRVPPPAEGGNNKVVNTVGTREVESRGLNLERLVIMLLHELDLSAPLPLDMRTERGEVAMLTFMFLALVLRNWRQPGTDTALEVGASLSIAEPEGQSNKELLTNESMGTHEEAMRQLESACALLRKGPLLPYLLDIVTRLSPHFKAASSGGGGDSLPTQIGAPGGLSGYVGFSASRSELASGSFAPFFSNSYAKAHRGDLFEEFHKLLLESAFRLAYSLIRQRASSRTGDNGDGTEATEVFDNIKGAEEVKLEGWQDILCSYMSNTHASFIRKYVRQLLLHVCGSKGQYYAVRDAWQLSAEVKRLHKLSRKSGSFRKPMPYERRVKLVRCLAAAAEVATSRPRNWQKHCLRNHDTLPFLLDSAAFWDEESALIALKLIGLAFHHSTAQSASSATHQDKAEGADSGSAGLSSSAKLRYGSGRHSLGSDGDAGSSPAGEVSKEKRSRRRRSGEDGQGGERSEKGTLDMEPQVTLLLGNSDGQTLSFINHFLLEWSAFSIRAEAKAVLQGAWHHGNKSFRSLLLTLLLSRVPFLPSYGHNVDKFSELLSWLIVKAVPAQESPANTLDSKLTEESSLIHSSLNGPVLDSILTTLRGQNELLANHPNSRLYNILRSLVEFDGYYLESEPCLACSSPEVAYSRMKLDGLKLETKYTDNRILVKCTGSHTIQSVSMSVLDARRSKAVKCVKMYYNNRAVADLAELKNNWSLWKKARTCQLGQGQTELRVDFAIPITACNFMIEFESFYENLQASSLESLQCPRCSRYVTDKHGICSNCHENAYQCRQCRNINYEKLDAFLCIECGYSKYGRFDFSFIAKPSFVFDPMESDEDMRKGLSAIEAEAENAHKKYQQLLGFKKPLLKLISSVGDADSDASTWANAGMPGGTGLGSSAMQTTSLPSGGSTSSGAEAVQQAMVSLPASSSFKISRKIALLGILYGEKCKSAFDSVSKSAQTLLGLQKVLMAYLEHKGAMAGGEKEVTVQVVPPRLAPRPPNKCFGCANTSVGYLLEWLQVLARDSDCRKQLVAGGILRDLFESNIHHGPRSARTHARSVLCLFTEGDAAAAAELNSLIYAKVAYCLEHHRSLDVAACIRDEMHLLSEICALADNCWEARLRAVFSLLFKAIEVGARHPVICEQIILPCLEIVAQACLPPTESSQASPAVLGSRSSHVGGGGLPSSLMSASRDSSTSISDTRSSSRSSAVKMLGSSNSKPVGVVGSNIIRSKGKGKAAVGDEISIISYAEWTSGVGYDDYERRHLLLSVAGQSGKPPLPSRFSSIHKDRERHSTNISRSEQSALRCLLKWRRKVAVKAKEHGKRSSGLLGLTMLEQASWVKDLVLSACSQTIRAEACSLIQVLSATSSARHARFLELVYSLLPAARLAGESAAEYFELFSTMVDAEDWRLFLTVRGALPTICSLMVEDVTGIEAQERSFHTNIAQGYSAYKLGLLLFKFLQVPNISKRFLEEKLLSRILEAVLALRGLVVQKTKLTEDCRRLLVELLDSLLKDNASSKRVFLAACVRCLQGIQSKPGRTPLYVLEQLCGIVCPSRAEPVYQLVLTKAHTQEEFIRGTMTKNPYSSAEVGPLMRDVKNKICQQLELAGLVEDDYGMELLVAGNIISLDLCVRNVFELVWRKAQTPHQGGQLPPLQDCPPMTVTFRLQGLDGEATEPIIKELEDEQEEALDPEVEFAVAGVMAECGGLAVLLHMVQEMSEVEIKSGQQEVSLLLKLLLHCCKLRANRLALLRLGALPILLDQARRAVILSLDGSSAGEEALESLLLTVESLVAEANASDASPDPSLSRTERERGQEAGWSAAGGAGLGVEAVRMFLDKLSTSQAGPSAQPGRSAPRKRNREAKSAETVARILPYLTFGELQAMEVLVDHFVPFLNDWPEFDRLQERAKEEAQKEDVVRMAAEHRRAVSNFVRVGEAIRTDASGNRLRSLILERGIPAGAVRYMMSAFPEIDAAMEYKSQSKWTEALRLTSIPLLLPLLEGLCKGHPPTQVCLLEEGILPLLHALEGVPGENNIGAQAESLLDTLAAAGEQQLKDMVEGLREATQREMKRRALQRREELLKGMGMARLEGLELVEEEEKDALSCMVCREGYRLRPQEMLGAYCFGKRFSVTSASSARIEWAYSTVTHFNVIHFQCHLEAKRADSALKTPKREWEGAALRNSETLCNGLFPLRGPEVPSAPYVRCCDLWWEQTSALGRADGSRLRLLLHDVATLIGRFATNTSFSADSKGGGRDSNAKLLPFQLQMATFLLDQAGPTQRRIYEGNLSSFLQSSNPDGGTPASSGSGSSPAVAGGSPLREMSGLRGNHGLPLPSHLGSRLQGLAFTRNPDESGQFMLMWSLLLQSWEQWEQQKPVFLRRALAQAYQAYGTGAVGSGVLAAGLSGSSSLPRLPAGVSASSPSQSSSSHLSPSATSLSETPPPSASAGEGQGSNEKALFAAVKPMLVFIGIVDQLQRLLKDPAMRTAGGDWTVDAEGRSVGNEVGRDGGMESGGRGTGGAAEEKAQQLEPWEVAMRRQLLDIDRMLKFAGNLLEWLEDVQGAADLQEAMDLAGFLGVALSNGCTSCEEFVWAAIDRECD